MLLNATSMDQYRLQFPSLAKDATKEARLKDALRPHLAKMLGGRAAELGGGGSALYDWIWRDASGRFLLVEAKRKLTRSSVCSVNPITGKLTSASKWTESNEHTIARLARMAAAKAAAAKDPDVGSSTSRRRKRWEDAWIERTSASVEQQLGVAWAKLPTGLTPSVVVAVEDVDSAGLKALADAIATAEAAAAVNDLRIWIVRPDRQGDEAFELKGWASPTCVAAGG